MSEIKLRIFAVEDAANGAIPIHPHFVKEFCTLQIRMSCECIALACLVAHEELDEAKSSAMQKAYAADQIIKRMESIHPRFFPQPITGQRIAPGRHHFSDFEGEYLTQQEILAVYARCGGRLHKGSLKSLKARTKAPSNDLLEELSTVQKIVGLLGNHATLSRDEHSVILCNFGPTRDGLVRVSSAREL
ncbi:hypothetical protein [Bradyrhizobium daqingense]|uniref:hypothetical protein n=1 Tax=Bradyrhizobium daqingense TaxID=993502 RepID=UPI003838E594